MSNPVVRRFTFSDTSVYVIEAGDFYLRFYTNRQQISDSSGVYEIVSPYSADDVRAVQWTQVNDIVYLTHPDYPTQVLTRLADDSWTIEDLVPAEPPFLDENITTTTLTPSGTSGSITILASQDIFFDAHVGSYWRIGHKAAGAYVEHPITANGASSTLQIYGTYTLRTYGNWGADIQIQRQNPLTSAWETVASYHGAIPGPGEAGFRNFDAAGTADELALYRINIANFDGDSESSAIAVLERPESVVYGYVQITDVNSGGSVDADVVESLLSTDATAIWAEGAWSAYRGYPRACGVHEQRLILAGTSYQPLTVWGSVVDDFENFRRGTDDDDAYAHTLAARGQATIQWLVSREALLVGTSLGQWRMRGDGFGAIITPTRVDAKKRDNEAAGYVTAEEAGAPIVFVGIKGLKVFASVYQEDADRIQNVELSILSEHITESGIIETAWQGDKRILWCVRADGVLCAVTYDETQEVVGWHDHTTQGYFRSVTTIPGDADAEDEVWVVVERTIGTETVFYVELFDPDLWDARAEYFGVDCGLTYEGSPETDFTGATHLAGMDGVGLADGVPFVATVDEHGAFSLPSGFTPASIVHFGLPYEAILETFRLDADAALGVHVGRTKKIDSVVARVLKSWGGFYRTEGTEMPIPVPQTREAADLLGSDRAEDVRLEGFQQDNTYDPVVRITQPDPLPLTVTALTIALQVGDN